jgi:hypothetical protein
MAFTMACPNFKKGLKMAFGPLGVNGDPNFPRVDKLFFLNLYKFHNLYILMDFYH